MPKTKESLKGNQTQTLTIEYATKAIQTPKHKTAKHHQPHYDSLPSLILLQLPQPHRTLPFFNTAPPNSLYYDVGVSFKGVQTKSFLWKLLDILVTH